MISQKLIITCFQINYYHKLQIYLSHNSQNIELQKPLYFSIQFLVIIILELPMNNNFYESINRDVSSSEDQCKCNACRNLDDLRLFNRKNTCNLNVYKHLKKRQGPPIKKDNNLIKQVSQKAKFYQKKQEGEKKGEQESKNNATPVKHKPMVDKNKEAVSPQIPLDYHPVSHSQRMKLVKGQILLQLASDVTQRREQRDQGQRYRGKARSTYQALNARLAEISENPENILPIQRNQSSSNRSSSHHQASPPCFEMQLSRVSEQHRN